MRDETIFIGDFSGGSSKQLDRSTFIQINSREEAQRVKLGEIIKRWDYVMEIKPTYVYQKELNSLRSRGDLLADKVVQVLKLGVGIDSFQVIEARVESINEKRKKEEALDLTEEDEIVLKFWENIHQEFSPEEEEVQRLGREVFWRYSTEIFGSLLHFSLAGGFSAPKLAAVMKETNYLTSSSNEATYKRLLETTLFVIDAMSSFSIGSRGWKSAIRVRLLHALVRRRIATGKGKLGTYDEVENGIPINQQDLLTVLGSFSIAPLWSLQRSGITLTEAEKSNYQSAWKQVGFYLGIEPDLLEKFYGGTQTLAQENFACLAFDSFPDEIPIDGLDTPTFQILNAVSHRPPRNTPVGYHLEYSRRLLGSGLADQLAIPRGSRRDQFKVSFDIFASYALINFGRYYPFKRWESNRIELMRQVLELLVVWQLGSRRTLFSWRDEAKRGEKFEESEGEAAGIPMGPSVGLAVKRKWKLLIAELVGVVGAVGVVGLGVAWITFKTFVTPFNV